MTSFRFLTRYQVVKPVLIGHSMAEENYHYRHWAPSVRTGLFTWMLRVTPLVTIPRLERNMEASGTITSLVF
jgi:hypothetical protein